MSIFHFFLLWLSPIPLSPTLSSPASALLPLLLYLNCLPSPPASLYTSAVTWEMKLFMSPDSPTA